MSEPRFDRHPTDEPDGTPAFAASLRPPGESVTSTGTDTSDAFDDADEPRGPQAPFDGPVLPGDSRAGYDVADASGDTDAVRPQE
jgi:hypothetical protein